MTDEVEPTLPGLEEMNEERLTKALGWDCPRYFANQAQVLVSADQAIIIFREAANINGIAGREGTLNIARNIASIVVPTEVARGLRDLLNGLELDAADE